MFKQNKYDVRLTLFLIVSFMIFLYVFSIDYEVMAQSENFQPSKKQDLSKLYWVISLIGGLIIITLSYVSWKKYKAEKKCKKKDSNS